MKCAVCGNEFGSGANCQYCGVDRITGLGNYNGYNAPRDNYMDYRDTPYTEPVKNQFQTANNGSTVCYACGEIIPVDSKFCPYCSRELYVTCPKCGHKYSSQFPACNQCGTNKKKYLTLERIKKMNPYEIPYGTISISNESYKYKSKEYIIIPETVTSIDDMAFEGCESLREIIIPSSVHSIGKYAFKDCKSLQNVQLPNIREIKDETFRNCKSLSEIILPTSVSAICECAFASCDSLRVIVVPDSVKSIGRHAFDRCSSLETVVLPDSLETIGGWVFECSFKLSPSTKTMLRELEKKHNVKLFTDI